MEHTRRKRAKQNRQTQRLAKLAVAGGSKRRPKPKRQKQRRGKPAVAGGAKRPARRARMIRRRDPVLIFLSYAHPDKEWFDRLRSVLHFDKNVHVVAWHDQVLQPGDEWDLNIREALERMDIFVPLVSFDFHASPYIRRVERKRAIERANLGQVDIVPIELFDVTWDEDFADLKKYNRLPEWGRSWSAIASHFGHYQAAHKKIRDGLLKAVKKVRSRRDRRRS